MTIIMAAADSLACLLNAREPKLPKQTRHIVFGYVNSRPLIFPSPVTIMLQKHMSVVARLRKISTCRNTTYLLPQSSQPLLLGVRIDVCADNKRYKIEERDPSVLGQELLGKRQGQW